MPHQPPDHAPLSKHLLLAGGVDAPCVYLLYELRRRGVKRGIGSACIGGGQGIALLL